MGGKQVAAAAAVVVYPRRLPQKKKEKEQSIDSTWPTPNPGLHPRSKAEMDMDGGPPPSASGTYLSSAFSGCLVGRPALQCMGVSTHTQALPVLAALFSSLSHIHNLSPIVIEA
jgi:hypothetical protein